MIQLRVIGSESWLDPRCSRQMAAALGNKLWDRCKGHAGLFVTLTYDRTPYSGPQNLYRKAAEEQHVALFLRKLGRYLKANLTGRWLCKLEFQRGGWAHWHIIILDVPKVPHAVVTRLWGRGHVWLRRLSKKNVRYCTKYVVKGDSVPAWLYAERPRSVKIIRTSPGFWGAPVRPPREQHPFEDTPVVMPGYVPIGDRIAQTEQRIVARDDQGHYVHVHADLGPLLVELLRRDCAVVGRTGRWLCIDADTVDVVRQAAEQCQPTARSAAEEEGRVRRGEAAAARPLHLSVTGNPDGDAFRASLPWWLDEWFRQDAMEAMAP